jgi:serine/threonine protein kinase
MHSADEPHPVFSVISLEFFENQKFVINGIFRGGMGVVYQLVPIQPGRPLALKTFQPTIDRTQFERECEIWLRLSSVPHIAKVLVYGIWEGQPAVVSEWYDRSLGDCNYADLATDDIVGAAHAIIGALRTAHQMTGLIHQDIKPSNILLDASRHAFLADFGLAQFARRVDRLEFAKSANLNSSETLVSGDVGGTPRYMAPELFVGGKPSVRTDLYSLGVTFYELLTCEHPFAGPDTGGRFRPILRDSPLKQALAQRGREVAPLVEVIKACLQLDPSARPQTYTDLPVDLLHAKKATTSAMPSEVERLVGVAVMMRKQGRFDEASQLLGNGLAKSPDHPVLLNAVAVLRLSEGKRPEAMKALERATTVLAKSGGFIGDKPYLDPVINFGSQFREQREFEQAASVFELAWSWVPFEATSTVASWYPEFGWLWLYRGEFSKATSWFVHLQKTRQPDRTTLCWLTESAWFAGSFDEVADILGRGFLAVKPTDLLLVAAACLTAKYATPANRSALLGLVSRDLVSEFTELEDEMNLPNKGLRPPSTEQAERSLIYAIDDIVTGGHHHGLIQ